MGAMYENQGQSNKAIEYQEMCLMMIQETKDRKEEAQSHVHLASSYQNLAQFQKATVLTEKGSSQ